MTSQTKAQSSTPIPDSLQENSDDGITQRCVFELFDKITQAKEAESQRFFTVAVSFL